MLSVGVGFTVGRGYDSVTLGNSIHLLGLATGPN